MALVVETTRSYVWIRDVCRAFNDHVRQMMVIFPVIIMMALAFLFPAVL